MLKATIQLDKTCMHFPEVLCTSARLIARGVDSYSTNVRFLSLMKLHELSRLGEAPKPRRTVPSFRTASPNLGG